MSRKAKTNLEFDGVHSSMLYMITSLKPHTNKVIKLFCFCPVEGKISWKQQERQNGRPAYGTVPQAAIKLKAHQGMKLVNPYIYFVHLLTSFDPMLL